MEKAELNLPSLGAAFVRARQFAEEHMTLTEELGSTWREETISEIVWARASPYVKFADFTRHQESYVGSDWLWWWVDGSGESFGMLVQAKRYFRATDRWTLDLKSKKGDQMRRLLRSAHDLRVPPVYVLYRGLIALRRGICNEGHPQPCPFGCERASLSILPAIEANLYSAHSARDAADMAISSSIPLEDLADPASSYSPVPDLHLSELEPDVRQFLQDKQTGARHVAQSVFSVLAEARIGDFSLATKERSAVDASSPIFTDLPTDAGHFGVAYYENVFRGLRTEVPRYVQDFLEGRPMPSEVTDAVAGLVVVSV